MGPRQFVFDPRLLQELYSSSQVIKGLIQMALLAAQDAQGDAAYPDSITGPIFLRALKGQSD